jgi:hypothetical protein
MFASEAANTKRAVLVPFVIFLSLLFHKKSADEEDGGAYRYRHIGYIEGWKAVEAENTEKRKGDEIDDPFRTKDPVDEIARPAAHDEGYREALQPRELPGSKAENGRGDDEDGGQYYEEGHPENLGYRIAYGEGDAKVSRVDDPEKIAHVSGTDGVFGYIGDYPRLHSLIGYDDADRQQGREKENGQPALPFRRRSI